MDIIVLNNNLLPDPVGLTNTGVICYFNSLAQCILSCTSIYEEIHKESETNYFAIIFRKFLQNPPAYHIAILQELCKSHPNFGKGQDSAREALLYLLNKMPHIERLFKHRYRCFTICNNCKNVYNNVADENIVIDMFDVGINSIKEKNIREIINNVPDYICEKCKTKQCYRIYKLTMVSEIIVLSFNIYFKRESTEFPQELQIGKFKYKQIGQIEHFGHLGGGHYISRALRKNNEIFLFNDNNFSSSSFQCNKNIYLVFYHKI